MTDLERRALLGDREAQEGCTEKEIMLPCPFCGGKAEIIDMIATHFVRCEKDGMSTFLFESKQKAVKSWNTRTAPLVGWCETCRYWNIEDAGVCSMHDTCGWTSRDFCSKYKSREG